MTDVKAAFETALIVGVVGWGAFSTITKIVLIETLTLVELWELVKRKFKTKVAKEAPPGANAGR